MSFNSSFIGQNSAISSKTRISHKYVLIKLYNFLDKSAFLKFRYCSFLNWWLSTSTAKITESWATSPTEQNPFLTASVAYSTWKRWPLGEKTVIAESYIQNYFKFRSEDVIKFILKLFIINILWPVLLKIKLLWNENAKQFR